MTVKVSWMADTDDSVTSYEVFRSQDKGLTYSSIAVVPFDTQGTDYDKTTKRFFVNDSTGQAGDVYMITATGLYGTSEPTIVIAPPAVPAKCLVVGYVRDAHGRVDRNWTVRVSTAAQRGENWLAGGGVVGQHPLSVGVVASDTTVHPDENGFWSVELLQDAIARISIPVLDLDWAFRVPKKNGPVNIRDIPQVRTADFYGIWPDMQGSRMGQP